MIVRRWRCPKDGQQETRVENGGDRRLCPECGGPMVEMDTPSERAARG